MHTKFIQKSIGSLTMRVIGEAFHPLDLRPGDHVYTFRRFGVFFYTHHGIFVGNDMVVHLTRTPAGPPIPLLHPWHPSSEHEDHPPCNRCCADPEGGSGSSGVVLVCLDCFRRDGSTDRAVRVYKYEARPWQLCFNIPGTSTAVSPDKSRDEVVQTARARLLAGDFGDYDLLRNNCEHFATLCVAGKRISEQADHWARVVAKLDRLTDLWLLMWTALCSGHSRPSEEPRTALYSWLQCLKGPLDSYKLELQAQPSIKRGNVEEILDANLLSEPCDMKVILKVGQLGLRCNAGSPKCCLTMTGVVRELEDALCSADSFIPREIPSTAHDTWTSNTIKIQRSSDDLDMSSVSVDGVGLQRFHVEMDSISFHSENLRCLEMNSISIDVDKGSLEEKSR